MAGTIDDLGTMMAAVDEHASHDHDPALTRIRPPESEHTATVVEPSGSTATPELTRLTDRAPAAAADSPATATRDTRPSPAPEPERGRVLGGRYRLEEVLGAGGMGVVFRASDLQVPGENFAIKVLKPKLQGHPELVRALREELRKTRVLSHPNIVGAYSISSDGSGDYMLMEYLEGETLQKLLDEEFGRGIPLHRAWPLITDMCAALAYAHDHNVVHSDLKPSNVFVTTFGKVKLLDFGIARVARGPIRGFDPQAFRAVTESYGSCEMLEGGAPDARDDVYALGCVVYEMLSGRHPFGRRSATEARRLALVPAPLATLSRRQNCALARALSFDREERTASVEAFQAQLQPRNVLTAHWPLALAAGLVAAVVLAAVLLFGRPPIERVTTPAAVAVAATGPTLAAVRALARAAADSSVDPDDSLLRVGLRALQVAEARVAAGATDKAAPELDKARASLQEAIRISPRLATVGTTPPEIESALQLCREETGNSSDCTPSALADDKARSVSLLPFILDTAPATNAEFDQFAAATGYVTAAERGHGVYAAAEKPTLVPDSSWRTLRRQGLPPGADPALYPVRGIDYAAAKAYCAWAGKRLPHEDEWEFAARGPGRRVFPWGDQVADAPAARLLPVNEQPVTGAFGGRGLGGQVWEWAEGRDGKPILRGPSHLVNVPFYQRLATRDREDPARARVDTGVRCALSSESWPDAAGAPSVQRPLT